MIVRTRTGNSIRRFGFTLTELLVVIAIIAILGTATVIGFQTVSRDAKLSSAQNAVMAALDQARGLALKTNNYTMVVFRPRFDDNGKQITEIVTTQFTGDSAGPCVAFVSTPLRRPLDRHIVAPGIPVKVLPAGVSIAAPTYGYAPANSGNWSDIQVDAFDKQWFSLSNFKNNLIQLPQAEAPGRMLGVLYSPEGTVVSRNSHADSYRQWVDFDNNGVQSFAEGDIDYLFMVTRLCGQPGSTITSEEFNELFLEHEFDYFGDPTVNEEPFVLVSPYVVVFDDAEARELNQPELWNDPAVRMDELSEYITANGKRIHFNRYSGVAMR